MGTATYSFKAKKINQLSFEVGDNIEIIVKQSGKPGWFKGRKGSKVSVHGHVCVHACMYVCVCVCL